MLKKMEVFLKNYFNSENYSFQAITNSASDRNYYRISFNNKSYILTVSENIKENNTFLYFSGLFKSMGIHVPEILKINDSHTIYLQEDIGDENLLSILNTNKENKNTLNSYKNCLDELIKLQFDFSEEIDFSKCYDFSEFNVSLVKNDLNYFKFYFFQPLEIPFSNQRLLYEFSKIAEIISNLEPRGFMFRDFQARNILIKKNQPFFIDYQGGMKGITVYDLVSLLWQAKAQLSNSFKDELKTYYFLEVQKRISITTSELEKAYQYCLLIRLLQVLGAYGFRGILQKKQHFMDSIFYGIANLNSFFKNNDILSQYPELENICSQLFKQETKNKITQLINE